MKQKHGFVTEDELRKRARKKLSARRELVQHLLSYILVNLFLWTIYLATWQEFPWPLFVSGGWGIGIVSHLADYYFKHGKGAEWREADIEREVIRQRRLARDRGEMLDDDEDSGYADTRVYDSSRVEAKHRRLSDDGELVDEAEYLRQRASR
ncbi:MAG: 2TM domain-containing protein [Chloroflexi bacterium]|nr:2TM domain-containing protein [Chloroflexota bacterium]MCY4248205.1 2TM domain-containing protein [Chloroflexota bacterium]